MHRTGMKPFVVCLTMILMLAVFSGCAQRSAQPSEIAGRIIQVTTSTGMIADLVHNIGGQRVAVTGLMGPGVDPHLYKASVRDIRKLDQADIIFYNGLDLEGRMVDTFERIAQSRKPTIAISKDINPQRLHKPAEFEGHYDPHIWFDVTLWQEGARAVNKALSELDPQSADLYQKNTDTYLKQLEELHQYTRTKIATIPEKSRVLITAHDAFGYFGAQYGVEVRGLQGTSTATEAGAGDVQQLANFIAGQKIKAIFVESSVPHATIRAVQEAVRSRGWEVIIGGELYADAMGSEGTPEGTYIGMVRYNVDTIVNALR